MQTVPNQPFHGRLLSFEFHSTGPVLFDLQQYAYAALHPKTTTLTMPPERGNHVVMIWGLFSVLFFCRLERVQAGCIVRRRISQSR